jgi:hypothetical protein
VRHATKEVLAGEVLAGIYFWGIITKVINGGNLCGLTMLKRSILLKEMCSRPSSRGMFNGAVEKLYRSRKCSEAPDSEQWKALSNSSR